MSMTRSFPKTKTMDVILKDESVVNVPMCTFKSFFNENKGNIIGYRKGKLI